jgi:mono/diheme cytochrome c family protein/uncharacterized cupredoxin-like copper-binding protein
MSDDDRTGRELTPRRPEDGVTRRDQPGVSSPERFSAGDRAHSVGLTEERSAQVVRQSGNARSVAFLAVLILALFIPVYWLYDLGIPALGAEGRMEGESQEQYVTDVGRGYALYLANCAQCHGENGEGGVGPPLNDQDKLYNAVTPAGLPGSGHLNPTYLQRVLEVGGRYVCGDPNSIMPAWQQPAGPLNYREVEELIAFLTASTETEFVYAPGEHGEGGAEGEGGAGEEAEQVLTGWRDPAYQPDPAEPTPPPCWRNPSGQIGGGGGNGGGQPSLAPVEEPGTAEQPRVIEVAETADLQITDTAGTPLSAIPVVPGEVIRFEVTNTAGFEHNFFIGEPEPLKSDATSGLPGVPTFVEGERSFDWEVPEDEAALANLQFACTVPGHYEPMHGSVVAAPTE